MQGTRGAPGGPIGHGHPSLGMGWAATSTSHCESIDPARGAARARRSQPTGELTPWAMASRMHVGPGARTIRPAARRTGGFRRRGAAARGRRSRRRLRGARSPRRGQAAPGRRSRLIRRGTRPLLALEGAVSPGGSRRTCPRDDSKRARERDGSGAGLSRVSRGRPLRAGAGKSGKPSAGGCMGRAAPSSRGAGAQRRGRHSMHSPGRGRAPSSNGHDRRRGRDRAKGSSPAGLRPRFLRGLLER